MNKRLPNEHSKKQELQHYVHVMFSKGFSESSIEKVLQKKGWHRATIDNVIQRVKLENKAIHHKKTTHNRVVKGESKGGELKIKEGFGKHSVKATGVQWFFFILFFVSLGLCAYTFMKSMWIAMSLGLVVCVISLVGYRLISPKDAQVHLKAYHAGMTKEERLTAMNKYQEALKGERIRRHNLREIIKKKHEEERYLRRTQKMKKREGRLRKKEELKATQGGKKAENKLKRIEKKNERVKMRETRLQNELDKIVQRRDLLEHDKKMRATAKGETDLDQLYDFVEKCGRIELREITNMFGVSKDVATEWMNILEGYKLAEIHYPAVGSPELRKCKK